MDAVVDLAAGRRAHAAQAWADAYRSLAAADDADGLDADDLELLATAAYMVGREDAYLDALQRAFHVHLQAGRSLAAVRCAFWVGVTCARRGDSGRAGGWLRRAERLLDQEGGDRVERGYLLLPAVFEAEASGDWRGAAATAGKAVAIAERFGDADLLALAAHEQGHVLVQDGRAREGLRLLDEAMVAVTEGQVSPIVAGIVYCGVILACQDAHDVRRAQEWTGALTQWCERQPDLVAFTGRCLIHRAELMQLHGAWAAARDEARRAAERCLDADNRAAAGEARYREGEIHRLGGAFAAAEAAYREASRHGREPQPGLALLRLAQGRPDAAAATIRRVAGETVTVGRRADVLAASVEILLAVDDPEAARRACDELEAMSAGHRLDALDAMAAQAQGALDLAGEDAHRALGALRRAMHAWQEIDAPYETARLRVLIGLACRATGDEDTARLELEAAREAFAQLGAAPDLAGVDGLLRVGHPGRRPLLTERELEVLRHVAAGATNREIARQLVLSVRTVDRHLSNVYAKLGVSSRAAATAYAHRHGLL